MSCELNIGQFSQMEWNRLIERSNNLSLQQLWEYGEAKQKTSSWKVVRMIFHDNGKVFGAAQASLRSIPFTNKGLIWIARAPLVLETDDKDHSLLIEQMLEKLKTYWVDQRMMYLRIAPSFKLSEANERLIQKIGYKKTNANPGWTSAKLDLLFTTEALERQMRKNWRQCLKKSEKLNVKITTDGSDELVRIFICDLTSFIEKKKFKTSATPKFIEALHAFSKNEKTLQVYSANLDAKHLGSIIIANYGNTAYYLSGAVNEEGRGLGVNHNLLWNAIIGAQKRGCRWFDVGGAHAINTPPGILYFKQGLGGREYQLFPEIEAYPPKLIYWLLNRIISKK